MLRGYPSKVKSEMLREIARETTKDIAKASSLVGHMDSSYSKEP
jgi:hypothetical protein